jgi:hypothetical protein
MIREIIIGVLLALLFFVTGFWLGGQTDEFPQAFVDYHETR